MVIGLGVLLVILWLCWRWREQRRIARQVRIAGLYWAFVDIIWIVMYCALYLIGR
jgi:cytochrome c oxidase subunit 3